MKRFLFVVLTMLTACKAWDVSGTSHSSVATCYAAMAGQDQNGDVVVWVREFKPCPPDSVLAATGWRRVEKPEWWPNG